MPPIALGAAAAPSPPWSGLACPSARGGEDADAARAVVDTLAAADGARRVDTDPPCRPPTPTPARRGDPGHAPPPRAGEADARRAVAAKTGVVPPAARPPVKAAPVDVSAEAAKRLDVARAKIDSNLVDQGIVDLRAIVGDYPGTPRPPTRPTWSQRPSRGSGRADDAMAAHVEFANRFAGDARLAASQLALADLTLKSRQPNRDDSAREIFGRAAAAARAPPRPCVRCRARSASKTGGA